MARLLLKCIIALIALYGEMLAITAGVAFARSIGRLVVQLTEDIASL